MTIVLLAMGSRGDTQPYLALGQALKRTGQRVRIAAFENFASQVESAELGFFPIPGDVSAIAGDPAARAAMRADTPLRFFTSLRQLRSLVFDLQQHLWAACQGAEAVVYHPGAAIGFFAAREQGVPAVLATPFPMTPTRAYPALVFYRAPRLGPMANLLTHRLFEATLWSSSRAPLLRFWKQTFGGSPATVSNPLRRQRSAAAPTLVGCSEHVFPTPSDWPQHVHTTGYWFLDREGWEMPADLAEFIEGGAPPVYVGFGGLGDPARAEGTTELVIEALQRSGRRGVLAGGWNTMARTESLPDSVHFIDSAPHSELFPRMAAVVHHGGAGTTAAALRAGVPSVVVPHGADQFAWGRRLHELGAAPPPIPRKRLTPDILARALTQASEPEMLRATNDLGEKVRRERGAARAAELIVDLLARNR